MAAQECTHLKHGRHFREALLSASEDGHHKCVKQIIADREKYQDNLSGKSQGPLWQGTLDKALNRAAKGGHLKTVEILLLHNANANSDDNVQYSNRPGISYYSIKTPLLWAVEGNHTQTVAELLRWHADPKTEDLEGLNAVSLAAREGHIESLEVLLQAGCKTNWIDSRGHRSPLMYAAGMESPSQC